MRFSPKPCDITLGCEFVSSWPCDITLGCVRARVGEIVKYPRIFMTSQLQGTEKMNKYWIRLEVSCYKGVNLILWGGVFVY